jgi:hypothetical protein
MRPTLGGPGVQPGATKGGGTKGVIMPIYTIGIIIFFLYTTMKVRSGNYATALNKDDLDSPLCR